MFRQKHQKGSMLLIAIGVLSLLVVYAITFFSVMATEKSASAGFVLGVKSEQVAKAGVDRAIADLKNYMIYENGDPTSAAFRNRAWDKVNDPWRYPETSLKNNLDLEKITDPNQMSFPASPQNGKYNTLPYSGIVEQTSAGGKVERMAFYRLKVLDCSSMLYINSSNPVNLKRILKNLLEKLAISDPSGTANKLVDMRPGEGYKSKKQVLLTLREIFGDNGESIFSKIQDHITCYAWVDESQVRPIQAKSPSIDPAQENQNRIFFEPRAPVNINTASEAVLYAVLKDIKGKKSDGSEISLANPTSLVTQIATVRKTTPFSSWLQFAEWLKTVVTAPEVDLMLANFNPNVDLNKFHPDVNMKRSLDKTDMVVYSTEFCFNSMGHFEITSLGIIAKGDSTVEASSKIQTVAKVFNVYRDTTQSDFETDRKAINARGRHVGIISQPEFSNARQMVQGADGELELRPTNAMCNFDGQLFINGLVRKMVLTNDFLLGFVRNDRAAGSLTLVLLPNNAISMDNFSGNPPRASNGLPSTDESESLFRPAQTDFFGGSDLLTLGLMVESTRGRYLKFSGQNMPLTKGSIEFWVKPHKPSTSAQEAYFYWGSNSGAPAVAIWREDSEIVAEFALAWSQGLQSSSWYNNNSRYSAAYGGRGTAFGPAGNPNQRRLRIDVSSWQENTWHHIVVTYGKFDHSGNFASEGRLYVDGQPCAKIAPFATTASGSTVYPISFDDPSYGATTKITQDVVVSVTQYDKDGNVVKDADGNPVKENVKATYGPTEDLPLKVGDTYTVSGGRQGPIVTAGTPTTTTSQGTQTDLWASKSFYIGAKPTATGVSSFADATIDNILVHHYIDHSVYSRTGTSFKFSRYSRPNDVNYPSYGTSYRKRLYPLEKQNVTLGNAFWTVYPSDNNSLATVTLEVNGTKVGAYKTLSAEQKKGGGYTLNKYEVGGRTDRIYYHVDFEVNGSSAAAPIPMNTSPIFDDMTVTYFTTAEVLAYYSFD